MKNLKRKLTLPALAILLAAGGAVMTSAKDVPVIDGYRYNVQQNTCENTGIKCSDIPSSQLCTGNGQSLFKLQGTTCQEPLYRNQP